MRFFNRPASMFRDTRRTMGKADDVGIYAVMERKRSGTQIAVDGMLPESTRSAGRVG